MLGKVEKYCTELLSRPEIEKLPFHNLEHTKEVVQNVKYLCAAMDINPEETQTLVTAAWFHDTGFTESYNGHEEVSKRIAAQFLTQLGMKQEFMDTVSNAIEATKMPQTPTSTLAEILCDADIFHISNSHFFYRKLLLRKEWELFCDKKSSDCEWHKLNLEFLRNHHFRSTYGKDVLTMGKEENLHKVETILRYFDEHKDR